CARFGSPYWYFDVW
nr:immunoglobulin heavy chain junction region [Mus musculus]